MQLRALGELVDQLAFLVKCNADDPGVIRRELGEDGAVGRVVARGEHLLDVERCAHLPLQRAPVNHLQRGRIGAKHDNWLNGQRIVGIAAGVAIDLADQVRFPGNDSTCQEGRDIKFLPGGEIISENDGEFGVEHDWQLHERFG